MDFTFNDDQLAFREAISRFLMTEAAPEMLREIWETDVGRSRDLRNKIAEQGLTALSVPEAHGGLGMDDVTWALMTQELGYYAIPDSLADTAYVACGVLTDLPAQHPARAELLPRIADGSLRMAISHPINALVSDAQLAEVLILGCSDEIHLVPRSEVQVQNHSSIDASRRPGGVTWT
ncbi:acyl-CoA dehydrogenase, partial [Pseudomonas sp. FSL R10-0765]